MFACLLWIAANASGMAEPPLYHVRELATPTAGVAVSASSVDSDGAVVGGFFNVGSSYFDAAEWDVSGAPVALSESLGFVEASLVARSPDGTLIGAGTQDPFEVSHAMLIDSDGNVTLLPSLWRSIALDKTIN